MNKFQSHKIQKLTAWAQQLSDGPMIFHIHTRFPDGSVLVAGSNLTDELKWFQRHNSFAIVIGPRGAIHSEQTTGFTVKLTKGM